jgi:hypothetical protein|tara:strand:+ start:1401 stop:1613 length:213 start_codon:yes stop_codon:yes gene_type:complete
VKVGDLVSYAFQASRERKGQSFDVGLVVETGKYTGNTDVKVLWMGPGAAAPYAITQKSDHLRLVDKSLTK